MSLLTPLQMLSIQALGQQGMTATVTVYASVSDVGLDLGDDPYGSTLTHSATASATTNGWLVGRWANERADNVGDIDTTTTYRLRLPVGTTIEPGWEVEIGGHRYLVVDAGTDQTWPEWLTCIVRRSK